MNTFRINAAAAAVCLAFASTAVMAQQSMSKAEFKAGRDAIAADYKSAKEACKSLSGNAEDICKAQASGNEKVAKAELDARNRPSINASYKARTVRADADYNVAKEKCDDSAGNAKDVCIKEAKAVSVAAKADARVRMKSNEGAQGAADARSDARNDKRDADYAVAIEKCDSLAGDAKSGCVTEAKKHFGKS